MDVIDRLPQTGEKGQFLKRQLEHRRFEHKHHIRRDGEGLPEIRNRVWGEPTPAA